MLERRPQEHLDELFQHELARNGLRQFEHCGEVQVLDRRRDRAHRPARRLVLPEVRMALIELPHLAVGSPHHVTAPRVSQVELRALLEATRCVEARSELIGKRLVVDKVVCVRRPNPLLVEAHGIEVAAFYSCDFRAHQRRTVFEILRTILGPDFELPVVSGQSVEMLLPLLRRCRIPGCSMRKRAIEVKLCRFELRR